MAKIDITKTFKDLEGNIVGQIYEGPIAMNDKAEEFLKDKSGKPLIARIDRGPDKALTLQQVICHALMAQKTNKDGSPEDIDESKAWEMYQLTEQVRKVKKDIDLSPTQVKEILERINIFRPTYIYGQAREYLDKS